MLGIFLAVVLIAALFFAWSRMMRSLVEDGRLINLVVRRLHRTHVVRRATADLDAEYEDLLASSPR